MLQIKDLHTGYGKTEVLRGVSLDVGDKEVVAVLGSNGVGKTTLNMVLSGVLPIWSGSIIFNGEPLPKNGQDIVAAGLIQVPEGRKIFPNLSIKENLLLGAYKRGKPRLSQNLDYIFETFPRLLERSEQLAGTLSGGEQQMLAIGRSLMAEPLFLIMDEPSLGLSPLMVEEMFTLINQLHADGLPIMLVEQNVVQSLEHASRAYILENGKVAISGDAKSVSENPVLRKTYLGM